MIEIHGYNFIQKEIEDLDKNDFKVIKKTRLN